MTDVGLTPLRLIGGLKELDLGGLQRTDSGLWQVTVTDRGAETLSGMTQLEILSLRNSKITDVGVDHLVKLKNLKRLDVVNTSLTDAGVARLRAALPNCDLRSGKVNQVRR
jgi:Leucine-rich repeat (LRR) protein